MKTWVEQRSGYDAQAINARIADITDKPQRIAPLTQEEMDSDARALIDRLGASVGAQSEEMVTEYFRTMIKHPELFRCQLEFGTAIFRGKLPARERELAVLRTGWLLRAPYEWGAHLDVGRRFGVTTQEVERLILGSTAPGWSEHDAAILAAVEQLLLDQTICDATWATLARTWTEAQLIEFTVVVGQYVSNAYVQNTLRMQLGEYNSGFSRLQKPEADHKNPVPNR
jgi:4-carboxymuconolactone decarboxylase